MSRSPVNLPPKPSVCFSFPKKFHHAHVLISATIIPSRKQKEAQLQVTFKAQNEYPMQIG